MRTFTLNMTALLGLIFLAATNSHAQEHFSISSGYFLPHVTAATLDKRMAHKGVFEDGVVWKDESGENTVFLCYDTNAQENKRDLYVYQYRVVGGKCSLVWDIQDFGGPLCDMTFVYQSLQLIDLDQDGILEVGFMYQNRCDGLDPYVTKLMLMKDGKKLALRGKFAVEDNEELEQMMDPVVAQYPSLFKNFMLLCWNEFRDSDFSFSKAVHCRTENYIVLKKEHVDASGGIEYQLLDIHGLPISLPENVQQKIRYSESLYLMPDRKTLFYADAHAVGTLDPITRQDNVWMTFLENTEAISPVVWSPDHSKIAFTALNHTYPAQTKVFVLTISGNTMVKKDKFDVKLMHMAASTWVVEAPRFRDNHTLEYTEMVVDDEGPREGDVKTIALD